MSDLFERSRNHYPEDFERFWKAYPARPGNPKRAAYTVWMQRIRQKCDPELMIEGAVAYAAYCEAVKSTGTPFVMMARTFIGPDLHFLEPWEAPEQEPEWIKLPPDDDDLWPWAQKHGFPNPGSMTYYQYRRHLQECVEKRKAGK